METMNAAVVTAYGRPPRCVRWDVPVAQSPQEVLVDVLAVGLHPRTRSGAAGEHYTSTGRLPLIPGIDGVGRLPDGRLRYFVADDEAGTMAQKVVVDLRRSVELPPGVDPIAVAAAMNPAMSSWVALRRRVVLQPGQSVLVLGATGNAGAMAVRVAKLLGAGRVVGAGRDADRLAALGSVGADAVVALTDDADATASALADAAADVDLVLDYLWGEPAEHAIVSLLTRRTDRGQELNWIQIGSVAGPTLALPSVALRSANFRLQGSGKGSVTPRGYLAELPALVQEIHAGRLAVATRTVPLSEVEQVWTEPDTPGVRTVIVP